MAGRGPPYTHGLLHSRPAARGQRGRTGPFGGRSRSDSVAAVWFRDRKPGADDTIFEDAAAAVGNMALLDKALEHVGDHLGRNPGLGRNVLDEIVAEPSTGDVYRLETAGPSHSGK